MKPIEIKTSQIRERAYESQNYNLDDKSLLEPNTPTN